MEQEIKLHTLSIDAEKSTESSIVIYTTDDDQVSCVKSKRGTQFRIWANRILKEYLIKGYAINVKIKLEHYYELKNIVRLISSTVKTQEKLTAYEKIVNLISVKSIKYNRI